MDEDSPGGSAEAGDVVRGERFSGGPARGFLSSLAADERLFEADLAVDRAHLVMLVEQEIVSASDARQIVKALDAIEQAGHEGLPAGEDVHAAIETAVIDRVGPLGGRLHTARSRNDEVATCIRHRLRADILSLLAAVLGLGEALGTLAESHRETTMPGLTHLQPAQPTTLAHYLCSYEASFGRDCERLLDAFERTNRSPLGAAAFAGTPFDIDRERTASLLGFDGLVENAMDAVSARDFLVETTAAVATTATHLSGLAADVILFANKGYVQLADDYASTSSIMPQKVNPDTMELVRGSAGDAGAGLQGVLTTLKGLPRAYNRDLQRVHGHAFDAIDAVQEATEVATGAVETADWRPDRLAEAAAAGGSTATGVADLLAMNGVPFRSAHRLVAAVADEGLTYDRLAEAATELLAEPLSTYVDAEQVAAARDPTQSVASRDSRGGPAPSAIDAQLERLGRRLAAHRSRQERHEQALADAGERLREVSGDL